MFSKKLYLVNLYGPNTDDSKFSDDLFLTLATFTGKYIIAEDFNCALNPNIGRSTGLDQSHNKCSVVIHRVIKELSLLDIWRELNTHDTAYSC